ncbi:SDR family oxidoreductase [Falsiroseomonas selenitidurans]|uniref:SDR family oxidoreductase n=1 Tax=Falsiroseomonas selenitidurans TaxID=2716335 RepID=A0ABX1EAV1_9PROT|nr:SDR family oxidoreductase [Falsiroseomonas selenitidurans]NKC32922.1 SDR family oxidoreductase [Falsiroseomonas selenitidurans]
MTQGLFDLKGRRVLITGSSRGIGFALARGLGQAGASVVLNGRDPSVLAEATRTLAAEGLDVTEAGFDVTDPHAIDAAVGEIETRLGPIEVLVNNAGINRRFPAVNVTPETFREVMSTNVEAVFFMAQACARRMLARGHGKIVNIASVQSELGRATISPYATSKGAVRMMTRTLCAEWAKGGIQVNAVAPGYFATDLTKPLVDDPAFTEWLCQRVPAGRWGNVEELVGAAVFLSSRASDFVNGHLLYVDGGMTAVV